MEQGICHPYLAGWAEIENKIRSNPKLIIHRDVQVGICYYQQSIYYAKEYDRIRTYGMDITQRKQAEETSQNYAEKLARSNRELEDLAFIASHDLNEPLRKIKAFGRKLVSSASKLDEQERDYLKRTINAATRMRQMIDGLLSLSLVTRDGQSFVQTDVGIILSEVLIDLEFQISRTKGSVKTCDFPMIQADPLQIRQLFQNLIGSALKYHRPGVPPEVHISCQSIAPNTIQIQIQDNGIGFDQSQMERIFQPLQRLVSDNEFEGSGMGLSICRKIVERHGGAIIAHSDLGQGSNFVITLPTQPLHS